MEQEDEDEEQDEEQDEDEDEDEDEDTRSGRGPPVASGIHTDGGSSPRTAR